MSGVLVGTVVSFGSKDFGFVRCEGRDKDIFFHLQDHREFHVGGDAVYWRRRRPLRVPIRGDVVVFQMRESPNGRVCAHKWGLKKDYDEAQRAARSETA